MLNPENGKNSKSNRNILIKMQAVANL